jgi:hypothetical protein
MGPRVPGKQGRVDVDELATPPPHEKRRQYAHEASENYEVCPCLLKPRGHLGLGGFTFPFDIGHNVRRYT